MLNNQEQLLDLNPNQYFNTDRSANDAPNCFNATYLRRLLFNTWLSHIWIWVWWTAVLPKFPRKSIAKLPLRGQWRVRIFGHIVIKWRFGTTTQKRHFHPWLPYRSPRNPWRRSPKRNGWFVLRRYN